jgi:predicted transposase YdaD
MIQTFYDPSLVEKGREEGRKEGRKEGTRLILQKQINKRFGMIPRDVEERIKALEQPQLEELAEKILEITTEEELRQAITIKH